MYSAVVITKEECDKLPIVPTEYSVELIDIQDIKGSKVYEIRHAVYFVEASEPEKKFNYDSLIIKFSLEKGIVEYNYFPKDNSYKIPWTY